MIKSCCICQATFKVRKYAKKFETRNLCAKCRKIIYNNILLDFVNGNTNYKETAKMLGISVYKLKKDISTLDSYLELNYEDK